MKAQWGEYSIALLYPTFGIRWRWKVNVIPRLLYAWKRYVPIAGGWVGFRTSLSKFWQRENPLPQLRIEPQTINPVHSHYTDYAIPSLTCLQQLSYDAITTKQTIRQRSIVIIALITERTVQYTTFFTICIPHVLQNRILDKSQLYWTHMHFCSCIWIWIIKCKDLYVDYCLQHQVCKVYLKTIKVNKTSGLQGRPPPLNVLQGITMCQGAKN